MVSGSVICCKAVNRCLAQHDSLRQFQASVITQTRHIQIAVLCQQVVTTGFQSSCEDGNFWKLASAHVTDLHITEQRRRTNVLGKDRLFVDMSLAVHFQVAHTIVAVQNQDDVFIAIVIHISNVKAQVGCSDIAAGIGKLKLSDATHGDAVEHGNLVGHVHHDLLHAVASLVLDALEVEGAGKVLTSEVCQPVAIIHFTGKLAVVERRHHPLVFIALGIEQRAFLLKDCMILCGVAIDSQVDDTLAHDAGNRCHTTCRRAIRINPELFAPCGIDSILIARSIALGGQFSQLAPRVHAIDIVIHKALVSEYPITGIVVLVENARALLKGSATRLLTTIIKHDTAAARTESVITA